MKINTYLLIIAFFTLIGCGNKNLDYNLIKQDKSRENNLLYTKKATLLNSLETKAIINATFLSQLYKDRYKKDLDIFLIGVYLDDDFNDKSKYGLNNPFYKLSSDGGKIISIREVKEDDIEYKEFPFTNNWAHYYVVSFSKSKNEKFVNLTYSHKEFGQLVLAFQKDW
jgi:hypothetical protein